MVCTPIRLAAFVAVVSVGFMMSSGTMAQSSNSRLISKQQLNLLQKKKFLKDLGEKIRVLETGPEAESGQYFETASDTAPPLAPPSLQPATSGSFESAQQVYRYLRLEMNYSHQDAVATLSRTGYRTELVQPLPE